MKATDLIKKSKTAKEIFCEIKSISISYPEQYKHFYPHFIYISDEVQVELLTMGFKIYQGEWRNGLIGLIIEW